MVYVGTFNFGEIEGKRLTFVIDQLCEHSFHAKLLKAPKQVLFSIPLTRSSNLCSLFFGQIQTPFFHFPRIRSSDTT